MKFNVFNGSVSFARGTITRALDRNSFLASALAEGVRQRLVSKEWWHLVIDPEPGFTSKLLFRINRLHQVYILMAIPSDEDKDGWTEEHELERKALHDAWLRRELGKPPYEYAWGSITSDYDAKGCVSEIIVSYAD